MRALRAALSRRAPHLPRRACRRADRRRQSAPQRGHRRAARGGGRRTLADLASGGGCARERYDLAIDFHGGPRASLLTLAERRARAHRLRRRRPQLDVHAACRAAARAAAAPLGREPVGPARGRSASAARSGRSTRWRCRSIRRAAARRRAPRRARASPPATALIVMHVSAGNPFRRWPLARSSRSSSALAAARSAAARRRHVRAVGAEAAERVIARRARRACGADARGTGAVVRRVLARRAARAARSRGALHRRRQRAAAHRGHDARCRSSGLYGPTLPARSAPWRDPACDHRVGRVPASCPAARAISACASRATSAA